MKRAAVCVIAVLACRGDAEPDPEPTPVKRPLEAPIVDNANNAVVPATTVEHPAAIVFIAANGDLEIGRTGKTWRGQLPKVRAPLRDVKKVGYEVLASLALDDGPHATDARNRLVAANEDLTNDDDDSGGTGTALALGQYGLQNPANDPQLARQQAIDQARAAGILGSAPFSPELVAPRPNTFPSVWVKDLSPYTPLIVAVPNAPASGIVTVVKETGGAIAIVHDDKLGVLVHAFENLREHPTDEAHAWIEVHLDGDGAHILEAGADPMHLTWNNRGLDRALFDSMISKLQAKDLVIDILVAPDIVNAQQLVDTIVALTDAKLDRKLALGTLTESSTKRVATLKRLGAGTPNVRMGMPNAQGDLDKAIIRRYIKRHIKKVQYCYEKELLAKPSLAGTVSVQFFITPAGTVASSSASGVDPEVSNCVANAIKQIVFPKPKGGGGVQVNYPFVFRQAGP